VEATLALFYIGVVANMASLSERERCIWKKIDYIINLKKDTL
jgi:hypothetical protein